MTKKTNHPAKFSDALLPVFASMLKGNEKVLDPFGGTGKIYSLLQWHPNLIIDAVEIEKEWATLDPRTTLGDALALAWENNYFDVILTSPVYGNRMSDSLRVPKSTWKKDHKYITYAQFLGKKLSPNNGGSLQWGNKYRDFHVKAWAEAKRVLKNNGTFILNIKNHIRKGEEQLVTEWHIETLESIGFKLLDQVKIDTPSMKFGQNGNKRVSYESVLKFRLDKRE